MQLSIKASGNAAAVNSAVATQIEREGKESPEAWPMLVNLRDYIGACVRKARPDAELSITVFAQVDVKEKEREPGRRQRGQQLATDTAKDPAPPK